MSWENKKYIQDRFETPVINRTAIEKHKIDLAADPDCPHCYNDRACGVHEDFYALKNFEEKIMLKELEEIKQLDAEIEKNTENIDKLNKQKKEIAKGARGKIEKELKNLETNIIEMVSEYNKVAKNAKIAKRAAYSLADMSYKFEDEEIPDNWTPDNYYHQSVEAPGAPGWFRSRYC